MKRRTFIRSLATYSASLSLLPYQELFSAPGFLEEGPYNGPLLTTYINSTCGACPGGCGIRVRMVDDIPVKIDGNPFHPVNRGGLCPVGAASLAYLVHPDRVKTPQIRTGPRGSGEYKSISWDEAEKIAINKLLELRTAGHPEQFLYIDGWQAGPASDLARKFVYDYGSPNYYDLSDPVLEASAAIWGGEGTRVSYDLENARIIYSFGSPLYEAGDNPVYHAGLRNRLLNKPEGQRGSVFIIDARLSASAAKSERWIPIKPGTHGLLALGMLCLIIKEELYDPAMVKQTCVGFEDWVDDNGKIVDGFKSTVLKSYYPSAVSDKTGVPVDQIIWLARKFANTPGAVALAGANTHHTVDGVYQAWAVMALNAVTGRFGAAGGVQSYSSPPFRNLTMAAVKAQPLTSEGSDNFPYLSGCGHLESLPDRILAASPYPIRLAIINGANPVYQSPQSIRFRQALQSIPFSIAFTILHNETSTLADLVLPDCTFLEKYDLVLPRSDFSFPVVGLMQPVTKYCYQARPAQEVLVAIGRELNGGSWRQWSTYASYLDEKINELFQESAGTLFSDDFKVSFESLLAERGWRRAEHHNLSDFASRLRDVGGWWSPLPPIHTGKDSFPTRSGKFYLVSEPLRERVRERGRAMAVAFHNAGLNLQGNSEYLLGAYRNFDEDVETQFPLTLYLIEKTTLRGDGGRLSAMADMVGYYENIKWQTWVELNPETATRLGLSDQQVVTVESAQGRQQLPLRLNPGLVPDVAAIPAGMGKYADSLFGKNVGEIISPVREVFTGMPATAETKVRIRA